MEGYFIRSSRVTPSVYFNPKKGLLDMRGKSSPENPLTFYNHIYDSLDQFAESEYPAMTVNMAFEYFNTSSSKCLYIFLKKLAWIDQQGKNITINWYFEDGDEDMNEAGEDLSCFFDVKFNFVEVPEIKVLGEEKKETKKKLVA